jgi:hypothetical protein
MSEPVNTPENQNPEKKYCIETKDLYKTLLDTRNFEINLFWQRSNYFLVLNSAIALGYFNLKEQQYGLIFAVMGVLASMLWFWVCLGGKFWQSRWEQRLSDFETENLNGLEFFSSDKTRIYSDVEKSLNISELTGIQKLIYKLVLKKPSVSYSMIRLSALFVLGWASFILTSIIIG